MAETTLSAETRRRKGRQPALSRLELRGSSRSRTWSSAFREVPTVGEVSAGGVPLFEGFTPEGFTPFESSPPLEQPPPLSPELRLRILDMALE